MTTAFLLRDIELDEAPGGVPLLKAYPDPISHGEPWTIGFGSTGPDIGPHTVWTAAQCGIALANRVAQIETTLTSVLPWWTALSDERQDVMVNMAYNMGVHGLLGFHNTLDYVQHGNYAQASANMLMSKWAEQVGGRASRLAEQMKTGVRAPR